jgi:PAB1-binding protein PBP1
MKMENEQLTAKESIMGDTKIEDNLNDDWDQFEQNKNKFNVESSYQEEKYTTKLNLEEIPEELKREAEKIEKVIKLYFLHFHSLY